MLAASSYLPEPETRYQAESYPKSCATWSEWHTYQFLLHNTFRHSLPAYSKRFSRMTSHHTSRVRLTVLL